MPDLRGNLTLAEVLLDLAQQPERLLELEDTPTKEEKIALLEGWYPDYFRAPGRRAFVENNIQQIRLAVEADYEASPGRTIRVMSVVITF
jgi:hypothetical protein